MSRMIWTILGAMLAVWLAFTAIGGIFAMIKTFAVIGLIAIAVFIIVWVLAGRARRGDAAR
jgi:L-asparagine transporter-like permease